MIETIKTFSCRHNLKEVAEVLARLEKIDWSQVPGGAPTELLNDLPLLRGILESPENSSPPDCMNASRWIVGFLDVDLAKKFIAEPSKLEIQVQLVYHLELLIAAAGLAPNLNLLDADQLYVALTTASANNPQARYDLVHSLDQIANIDKKFNYKVVVFQLLKNPEIIIALTKSEEIFLRALLLRVAWQWLRYLNEEEKNLICQRYFYEAVILGLPIRELLKQYLYDAPGAMAMVLRSNELVDMLSKNVEPVVVVTQKDWASPTLGQLFRRLQTTSQPPIANKQIVQVLEEELKENKEAEPYIPLMEKNLRLLVKIYQGELIEHTYLEEDSETILSYKEQTKLLLFYFSGSIAWPNFVTYYSNPNPVVPLKTILLQLYSNENLADQKVVQRLLDFTDFLKENRLLKDAKDLIVFHESDGQFHWNEEMFRK